jgi:hypothetical protein
MNNQDFETNLLLSGLTKQKFAEITSTPIGTIRNWTSNRKDKQGNIPNWVEAYLSLYLQNRKNEIYIEKLIKELKNE